MKSRKTHIIVLSPRVLWSLWSRTMLRTTQSTVLSLSWTVTECLRGRGWCCWGCSQYGDNTWAATLWYPTNYLLIPGTINLRPRCAAVPRPRGGSDNFFPPLLIYQRLSDWRAALPFLHSGEVAESISECWLLLCRWGWNEGEICEQCGFKHRYTNVIKIVAWYCIHMDLTLYYYLNRQIW